MNYQRLQINAAGAASFEERPNNHVVNIEAGNKRKCVLLRQDVVNVLVQPDKSIALPVVPVDVVNNTIEHQDLPPTIMAETLTQEFDNEMDENASGWDDCDTEFFVSLKDHDFMHTTDQKWTVDLLKILDDINAPDYAFGKIFAWARGANAEGYSFKPTGGLLRSKILMCCLTLCPMLACCCLHVLLCRVPMDQLAILLHLTLCRSYLIFSKTRQL